MVNKDWDDVPYVAGDCIRDITEWNSVVAWIKRVVAATAVNYTPSVFEVVIVDAVGGERTITLPAVHENGNIIDVKKVDASANNVIVDGDGADTIDGALTQTIGFQYESICVVSDGSNWFMI